MNRDTLEDALSHISDSHIAEAAKKRTAPHWGMIAACLVLILGIGAVIAGLSGDEQPSVSLEAPTTEPIVSEEAEPAVPGETGFAVSPSLQDLEIFTPETVQAENLLASPQYPELAAYSADYEQWQLWREDCLELHENPEGYIDSLNSFFARSIPEFLSGSTNNTAYSPVSLYMALAMLAQTAGGQTQQEILDLLGADSAEALAQQAGLVFRNHYWNDGAHTSVLANSLWLDDTLSFRQSTVDTLAEQLYASVYQGALESPEMNIALKDWLNAQTGGLLENSIRELNGMDETTAMVLCSTILYRVKWNDDFQESQNTNGIFHSATGDRAVTFMNRSFYYNPYYWGEDFTAIYLRLDDNSRMWLILPDEGYTPQDTLASGNALDMILNYSPYSYPDQMQPILHLSLPKFDVTGDLNLIEGLKNLGITQAMDRDAADFSGIETAEQALYLSSANQATRVAIDEEGVIAASYTVMMEAGGVPSPEDEVNFVLDRPFLFVVESADGVPMFTGIVNQP